MRNIRTAAIAVLGTAALLAPAGTALAATTTQTPHIASASVLKANAADQQIVRRLIHNTNYTPIVRRYTPQPTSTRRFNGYEQIIVRSPKGTAPVAGYFRITGADAGSVVVTSARVDLKRNAYVVNLEFPGEQGNSGHLVVTTISR